MKVQIEITEKTVLGIIIQDDALFNKALIISIGNGYDGWKVLFAPAIAGYSLEKSSKINYVQRICILLTEDIFMNKSSKESLEIMINHNIINAINEYDKKGDLTLEFEI